MRNAHFAMRASAPCPWPYLYPYPKSGGEGLHAVSGSEIASCSASAAGRQNSELSTQPRECRSRGSHTVRTPVTATSPGLRPALRHHRSLGVSWVWIHAHRAEVTRCIRDIPARTIKTIPAMYPIREQATQPTRVQLNARTRQRRIHPGATREAMALPN